MPLDDLMRARSTPVGAAAAAGLVTTLGVAAIPGIRFAYESLELHVALEAAQGVVAILLCYLAFGRLRTTMRRRDLMLTLAFAAFAATNLFVSVLPVALQGGTAGLTTWLAAGLRLVAAATLAVAALSDDRPLERAGLAGRTVGAVVAVLAAVVAAAALAERNLADLIDPSLSPEASQTPLIAGHPLAVAVQVTSTVAMAVAAAAFLARALRTGDDLFRWLAAGATLGAFARLNYVLFPSLYTEWFYTGDLLRFGSYLLFLVGAAREIGVYWRGHAQVAVMEERRRVARELHDGLAQELSFIRSQLHSAGERGLPPERACFVSEAAERALFESRQAIEALVGLRDGETFAEALRDAAETVADREDVTIEFAADPGIPSDSTVQPALERIVREAVGNAIRHGHASTVGIRVEVVDEVLVVQVEDDGEGFDVDESTRARGFGLVSIRERTEALGGELLIESTPGEGTTVHVTVPAGMALRR